MANALKHDLLGIDDYLAGERDVDVRSEYVEGLVYAMAGASETHNTIATTFSAAIDNALRDGCRSWQSDMKVIGKNQGKHFAYYPDIMAACGENTGDQYARTNPLLIVEVLSPNTQRIDLKEKFDNYISLPSLLEYVVVAQDMPLIRVFRRRNAWEQELFYAGDELSLESVGLTVGVEHVYRRVQKEVGLV